MADLNFDIQGKSLYFASDFHLGAPNFAKSRERETRLIKWLEHIEDDAQAIFLLGDIFDFWFEYKHTIPKGYTRFLGKIAQLRDMGIPIYFFTGNHDMWMFDYFPTEFDIPVYRKPIEITVNGKSLLIGHGDGLGPGDHFYKFLKKVFANPAAQWLFGWIHPNVGIAIAHAWSRKSRLGNQASTTIHKGEKEWLWQYCNEIEATKHHEIYIFGHRHLPLNMGVGASARYVNLGEWVNYCTYFQYDGKKGELLSFD